LDSISKVIIDVDHAMV